jgi:hypothetical protein
MVFSSDWPKFCRTAQRVVVAVGAERTGQQVAGSQPRRFPFAVRLVQPKFSQSVFLAVVQSRMLHNILTVLVKLWVRLTVLVRGSVSANMMNFSWVMKTR